MSVESEKEKYKSEVAAMKQLFCQEMRIEYDENVRMVHME